MREKKTHTGYLEALLTAEIEERERNTIDRRIKEAHLPRVKTLEEFDYTQSPMVTAAKMRELGGRRLYRTCGTGFAHRRLWDREDSSFERSLRRGMPAETASSIHDGGGAGERTGGSQTPTPVTAGDGALEPLRSDRD